LPQTEEEKIEQAAKKREEAQKLKEDLAGVKIRSESRYSASLIKFLNGGERTKGVVHVTQTSKDCPREAAWEYQDDVISDDTVEQLDERTMIAFYVGKRMHETQLTDTHEFALEYKHGDITLHGTLDEALVSKYKIEIYDKKSVKYMNTHMPYQNHKEQINAYAMMLFEAKKQIWCIKCNKSLVTNVENSTITLSCITPEDSHEMREQKVNFTDREYFGSVIYINVGEAKSIWEHLVVSFPFKVSIPDTKHRIDGILDQISNYVKTGIPPKCVHGWSCGKSQYWQASVMLDAGEANWKRFLPRGSKV